MAIVIIGIIIIIAGFIASKSNEAIFKYSNQIKLVGILVVLVGLGVSCVKQIGAGEVGVQTLFGRVNGTTLNSGLNFVNPLVEVTTFDIKTQNYTMSSVRDEGDKAGDDAIRVLTKDGLEVIIDLTVLYRVLPSEAPNILKDIGADYKKHYRSTYYSNKDSRQCRLLRCRCTLFHKKG